MTSKAEDREIYIQGERLRLRHLIAAVEQSTGLSYDDASDVVLEVDEAVTSLIAEGHGVVLPRVGPITWAELVGEPFGGELPSSPRTYMWLELAPMIAEPLGFDQTVVATALATIASMVEGAAAEAAVYVPGLGCYHGPPEALDLAAQDDYEVEIERLASLGTNIWLLQCNPEKFDVHAAIEEDGSLPTDWSINRYRDDVREGDRVVFWLSGAGGGVAALGEITGPPFQGDVDARFDGKSHAKWDVFVPLDLTIDLFDHPIPRSVLKADPRFAADSIIRIPGAANPHPVSWAAFKAIIEQLPAEAF